MTFMNNGLGLYLDGLSALRTFVQQVLRDCEEVLKCRSHELGRALFAEIRDIGPYLLPNLLNAREWDGTYAFLMARAPAGELGFVYVGALWLPDAHQVPRSNAAVILQCAAVTNAEQLRSLLKHNNRLPPEARLAERSELAQREVGVIRAVSDGQGYECLKVEIDQVIDDLIHALRPGV